MCYLLFTYIYIHVITAVCDPKCQNGGSCMEDGFETKCACMPGFTGQSCEESRILFIIFNSYYFLQLHLVYEISI
jgi:hypothetical protein